MARLDWRINWMFTLPKYSLKLNMNRKWFALNCLLPYLYYLESFLILRSLESRTKWKLVATVYLLQICSSSNRHYQRQLHVSRTYWRLHFPVSQAFSEVFIYKNLIHVPTAIQVPICILKLFNLITPPLIEMLFIFIYMH